MSTRARKFADKIGHWLHNHHVALVVVLAIAHVLLAALGHTWEPGSFAPSSGLT